MLSSVKTVIGFLTTRQRMAYLAIVVGRMLIGLLDVAGIVLIGLVASIVTTSFQAGNGRPVSILGITLPQLDNQGIFGLVALVLVVFVVKATLAVGLTRVQTGFVARIESVAAGRIALHLLGRSLADLKSHSKAEVQFAVTGSSTYAFTGLLNNVVVLFAETFLLLLVVVTLMLVNVTVAIFAFLYFGLFVVVLQLVINRSLKVAGRESVEGTVATMARISDTIDAFREISVLGKQRQFIQRVADSRRRISRSDAMITFLAQMPRYLVETALILGVLLLIGQQLLTGGAAAGFATVGVFLAGGVRVTASLLPLQSAISNLRQNSQQASAAISLLDEARNDDLRNPPRVAGTTVLADGPIGVELRGVSFRYSPDAERDTLADIDLEIPPGTYAAFIGPSGAGKTTLVDVILGLVSPRDGVVLLSGIPPLDLRTDHPGVIGYVAQKPGLVSGSIAENVALGVPFDQIDRERVRESLSAAFLGEFVQSLPEGIDTSVGKQADSLSGGQVQRIGIARALYGRPRLLVMDEATSGLDAASESMIADTLRSLGGDVTLLVVAHRLSTVQRADAVHVIEHGHVTSSGTFREVVAANPTVAEYVKLMSFGVDGDGDRGV